MSAPPFALVADQVTRGESIISAATFVGDVDDFDLWRRKRATWASDVKNVLCDLVPAAGLHEFERLASAPAASGSLHEDLPLEVHRLREAVEWLRSVTRSSEAD
jgi:hypothetical protein